jgi:superfamily I DNA/RNA helicase
MHKRTPEQLRIRDIRTGINVIAANAGTGKTDSLADLIATIYRYEEERRFPGIPHPVTGDNQRALMEQIMPVTFTRAAAAEFNERVLSLFEERGIPKPIDRWGRPWRVARTLDSYIQRWFRRELVFKSWMKVDDDFRESIERAIQCLSPGAREIIELEVETGRSAAFAFGKRWSWIPSGQFVDFVLDGVVREAEGLEPVPGVDPLTMWKDAWTAWMGAYAVPPRDAFGREVWGAEFWEPRLAPYLEFQKGMYELRDRYRNGDYAASPELKAIVERLQKWERIQQTKREFSSVYELARARGYHPVRAKEKMMDMSVLKELAASDYISSFQEFHGLALRLYSAKNLFLFLDYSDFLNLFVEAAEGNPTLLEQNREYPRNGIRSKYTLFDEAQDNNYFQNRLVEDLWRARPGVDYCTVACGDVKQAIYGFKGASSYGFSAMIERAKKNTPDKFFTLTVSFRSLPTIVDFGNQIVQTLPHYKDTVFPSSTIYTEPGEIKVFPPVQTPEEESMLVIREILRLLESTRDTIMVVHRNNFRDHPILPQLEALKDARVQWLTIHRSKGLQADHVFVMGLTSGLLPDVRGSYTQEVNLFYVACTRPRRALYLSAPYTKETIDKHTGLKDRVSVGPSVFFLRLPLLAAAADGAGWPTEIVEKGEKSRRSAIHLHDHRTQARDRRLRQWWRDSYPHIPLRDRDDEIQRDETGGAPAARQSMEVEKRRLWVGGEIPTFTGSSELIAANDPGEAHLKDRVRAKLKERCLKKGEVGRLTRDEWTTGIKSGWIFKGMGGITQFTEAFAIESRGINPTAAKSG